MILSATGENRISLSPLDYTVDLLSGLSDTELQAIQTVAIAFLNNNEPKKIIKIYNNGCFEIEMKNSLSKENYISGGIVEEYKETTKLKFESFSDNFIKPSENFIKIDLKKNKTNILLHCAFVALHMYYLNNNSLPELNNLDQVEKLINLSENYYKESLSRLAGHPYKVVENTNPYNSREHRTLHKLF